MSSPPPIPPSLSALGLPPRLTLSPDGSLGIKTPAAPTESLEVVGSAIISEQVTVAGLTVTGSNAAVTMLQTPTTITGPVTLTDGFTMPALGFAANLGALQVTAGGLVGIGTVPNGAGGVVLDLGGAGGISAGSVSAAGTVTASAGFFGDSAGLTGFAPSARTDTTNAANITAGTLGTARLPARLPAVVSAGGFVGVGANAPPAGATRGLAGAPRLDLVAEALTARPCAIPPSPMTAAETVFGAGSDAVSNAVHLAGTYTAAASTEAPGTAAWFALDADTENVWQSIAEYTPSYAPAGVPVTTRDAQNVTYAGHYIQLAAQIANSSGMAVTGYEITAGSAFTAPASWVLLGSVLGNTWTVLDAVTDAPPFTGGGGGAARFGIVGAPAGLALFRLVITKTAGGNPATPARAGIASFRLTTTHGVRLSVPLRVSPADAGAGAAGAGVLVVAPNGNVGIGTETPTAALHIAAAAGAPRFAALGNGGSTIPLAVDALGNLTTTLSDARLKHRIRPLSYGLSDICALRPVHYEWVPEEAALRGAREQIGLLAQEVAAVIPEAVAAVAATGAAAGVQKGSDAPAPMLSLDATALIPVLIRAVQEVTERLERLEMRMSRAASYAGPHGSYASSHSSHHGSSPRLASLPESRRGSDDTA